MEGQIGLKTAQVCLKMLDAGKIEIITDDKQTCIFGYPMFRETHTYFLPRKNVYLTDSFGFVTIITRTGQVTHVTEALQFVSRYLPSLQKLPL